jgi:hypothetical protein
MSKAKNLLDRDSFREAVFARDSHLCVICGEPAIDAHHIVERRLWDDFGYYIENGVSLCEEHHIKAEQTLISCEELREAAGITRVILPAHLYEDETYDKWSNIITSGGARRIKGELFDDESVQKVLASGGVLPLFTPYVKFPRTYHLPWSDGLTSDDRMMPSTDALHGKRVVVQVKLDGENTSLYRDYIHARSLDSQTDVTRSWIKNLHNQIRMDIPDGWRLSVENLFAKHTIKYENSEWAKEKDFAILFRVWDDKNRALSWDETKEWGQLLGLRTSDVLYDGIFDEAVLRKLYRPTHNGDELEGYVCWNAESFHYKDYRRMVGKYVTRSFKERVANAHGHWRHTAIERNG